MIKVKSVQPASLGSELGLEAGTELLEVNGRELADFLDWEYLTADEQFLLRVRMPAGDEIEFDIERPEGLPMGVELEPARIRRCANRCDFCFVDGNPEGLREAMYIRDDDYRLSFRYGNFATLTNLKQKDIDRILEYQLSPLYVSVHASDPVIRRRLLRNPSAPAIIPQLRAFASGGISAHTQIVLQPGVNDGAVLHQTLEDLYGIGDAILSVSVVPVGLTEFSKQHLVREPTAAECRDAIGAVDRFAERALPERHVHWVYGSDELYLVADLPLPAEGRYDDFEQVENGVGSVRYLQREIRGFARDLSGMRVGVVTGTAMGRLLPAVLRQLESTTGGSFRLLSLENELFGPRVTTAGLLPGRSIGRRLEQQPDLDVALIPAEALNDDDEFVDGSTLAQLSARVRIPVYPSYDFADALQDVRR